MNRKCFYQFSVWYFSSTYWLFTMTICVQCTCREICNSCIAHTMNGIHFHCLNNFLIFMYIVLGDVISQILTAKKNVNDLNLTNWNKCN